MKVSRLHRNLYISLAVALSLVIIDYAVSNMKYPVFDNSEAFSKVGYALLGSEDDDDDELFTVNVAYDKGLAAVVDEFGDTIGNAAVTDREKLCRLLDIMRESGYRYAFMDIRFEEGIYTPFDSALYERIIDMPRLIISTHEETDDYHIADDRLMSKAAYADYRTALNASFSRYRFLDDDGPSVSLRMYRDICHRDITRHGIFYTDANCLCYNSQFLPLLGGYMRDVRHSNLGWDILDGMTTDSIKSLMNDRIVLIGDFDNDTHSTYLGELPGPLLSYYAFRLLEKGGHKVNFLVYGIFFIFMASICFFIISDIHPLKFKSPVLNTVLSLISWDSILYILQMTLYLFFKQSFSFVIPAFVFSALIIVLNIRKSLKYQ